MRKYRWLLLVWHKAAASTKDCSYQRVWVVKRPQDLMKYSSFFEASRQITILLVRIWSEASWKISKVCALSQKDFLSKENNVMKRSAWLALYIAYHWSQLRDENKIVCIEIWISSFVKFEHIKIYLNYFWNLMNDKLINGRHYICCEELCIIC